MTVTTGQKLTIIGIDEAIAMTHRTEIQVKRALDPTPVGYQSLNMRVGTYARKGKRKEFYLDIRPGTLVFDGWDIPFRVDTDSRTGVMSGNACYNLVGDPDVIREYIETKQLNPRVTDRDKAQIIVWSPESLRSVGNEAGCILLYGHIETSHAVIQRIKEVQRVPA